MASAEQLRSSNSLILAFAMLSGSNMASEKTCPIVSKWQSLDYHTGLLNPINTILNVFNTEASPLRLDEVENGDPDVNTQ